jgi:hypothetical protein
LENPWVITLPRVNHADPAPNDAAMAATDHVVLANVLAQDEIAAHIQVHHLVPRFQRMVFGRRTPGCACVVQQDINMAKFPQCVGTEFLQIIGIGTVRRHEVRINASGFQFSHGLL